LLYSDLGLTDIWAEAVLIEGEGLWEKTKGAEKTKKKKIKK